MTIRKGATFLEISYLPSLTRLFLVFYYYFFFDLFSFISLNFPLLYKWKSSSLQSCSSSSSSDLEFQTPLVFAVKTKVSVFLQICNSFIWLLVFFICFLVLSFKPYPKWNSRRNFFFIFDLLFSCPWLTSLIRSKRTESRSVCGVRWFIGKLEREREKQRDSNWFWYFGRRARSDSLSESPLWLILYKSSTSSFLYRIPILDVYIPIQVKYFYFSFQFLFWKLNFITLISIDY